MMMVPKAKPIQKEKNQLAEEVSILPNGKHDCENKRRTKKQERHLGAIKSNIDVVKELLEQEFVGSEVVMVDTESSRLTEGKTNGKDERKPRIPFRLGETDYLGLCDLSSTVNIVRCYVYEILHHNLNDLDHEPTNTTIMFSNRT
jgi:hypothetical protein